MTNPAPAMSRAHYDLVVMTASAGGIEALGTVLSRLPADFPAAVAIVLHRTVHVPDHLRDVLARRSVLPVRFADTGLHMNPGTVYVARADAHLVLERNRTFGYRDGKKIRFLRSSVIPLLHTAAEVLDSRVIGVVLTGRGMDATDGVQAIRAQGGVIIAQDRASSHVFDMPKAAIATGAVDFVLPLEQIGPKLEDLVFNGRN